MRLRGVILLLIASACATEPTSTCDEAVAQLTSCNDDQRAAFAAACEAAGGDFDPAALVAEDSTAACAAVPDDGKADAQTNVVTGLCVAAMYAEKWAIGSISPEPQALPEATRARLRPLFGSLVDSVRVSNQAELPPKIVIAGRTISVEPAAMTFGSTIFINKRLNPAIDPFTLLVHELTHAQQASRAGGYYNFTVNYCRAMVAATFNYNQISLEVAAYDVQHKAEHALATCGQVTCP